ncbi:MAG: 2-phospho-L-lactate transferase [Acidimicrobiia bacterium]
MNDAIQGLKSRYSNPFAVLLAGGVGGARAARSLRNILRGPQMKVIGNVGDDDHMYGVPVSADLDTMIYTLAGIEGPEGWGIRDDTFAVMDHLQSIGVDTSFRLGDRDLATCLNRARILRSGGTLSEATASIAAALGVDTPVLPSSDDPVHTRLQTADGSWLSFQEYFVERAHRDVVTEIEYSGAADASPAPGTIEAIDAAALIVIAPSNPPLSIGPILAVDGIAQAVARHRRVVAISPLFDGKALKGPADRVMASLGYPPGNAGLLAAYEGFITDLVIDTGDADEAAQLAGPVDVHVADTRLTAGDAAGRFAQWFHGAFA